MILTLLHFRGTIAPATAPQAGVEQVSQRVAEHVGAPDDDEQGKPGKEAQPGVFFHIPAAFSAQHAAPTGLRRRNPESQKTDRGLRDKDHEIAFTSDR